MHIWLRALLLVVCSNVSANDDWDDWLGSVFCDNSDYLTIKETQALSSGMVSYLVMFNELPKIGMDQCLMIDFFDSYDEYLAFHTENNLNFTSNYGYFSRLSNTIYLYKGDSYLNTLVHEFIHFIIYYQYQHGDIPAWANEGIAEYAEGFYDSFDSGEKGKNDCLKARCLYRLLKRGSSNRILYYFFRRIDHGTYLFESYPYRSISWSIIHFLLFTDKAFLKELINFVSLGSGDSVDYIQDKYKGGLFGFEKDWRQYIRSNTHFLYHVWLCG